MQRATVFVSSPIVNFEGPRAMAKRALEDLGYEVVLSEDSTVAYPSSETPLISGVVSARNADVLIAIIAPRLGTPYHEHGCDSGYSVSQMEREEARVAGSQVLTFVSAEIQSTYERYRKHPRARKFTGGDVELPVLRYLEQVYAEQPQAAVIVYTDLADLERRVKSQMHALTKRLLADARTSPLQRNVLEHPIQPVSLRDFEYLRALVHPANRDVARGCSVRALFLFRNRNDLIDFFCDVGFFHIIDGQYNLYFLKPTPLNESLFLKYLSPATADDPSWSAQLQFLKSEFARRPAIARRLSDGAHAGVALGFCPNAVFAPAGALVDARDYETSTERIRFAFAHKCDLGVES